MEYILSKLKDEKQEITNGFYTLIKPNSKCILKGNAIHGWTATFNSIKTKKVIMTFKFLPEEFNIKLNLKNINNYIY